MFELSKVPAREPEVVGPDDETVAAECPAPVEVVATGGAEVVVVVVDDAGAGAGAGRGADVEEVP